MHLAQLATIAEYMSLEPDQRWGIPSVKSVKDRNLPHNLDLIIMPGVVFDTTMGRLGHGKGYYDKFMAKLEKEYSIYKINRPTIIALALREQVLAGGSIPMLAHDFRPDYLVTPDTVYGRKI